MSSADPGEEVPRETVGGDEPRGAGPTGAGSPAAPDAGRPDAAVADAADSAVATHRDPVGADASPPPDAMTRGYARGRAKTEAIQAGLQPLGLDERPLGLKLATALAAFIAVANFVAAAFGAGGESPATGFGFAILMLAIAGGLWTKRYLVILLFQALLALSIIVSTLSLAFASNLLGVLLALTVIGLSSPVFWLLVRVMARLQVPPE